MAPPTPLGQKEEGSGGGGGCRVEARKHKRKWAQVKPLRALKFLPLFLTRVMGPARQPVPSLVPTPRCQSWLSGSPPDGRRRTASFKLLSTWGARHHGLQHQDFTFYHQRVSMGRETSIPGVLHQNPSREPQGWFLLFPKRHVPGPMFLGAQGFSPPQS